VCLCVCCCAPPPPLLPHVACTVARVRCAAVRSRVWAHRLLCVGVLTITSQFLFACHVLGVAAVVKPRGCDSAASDPVHSTIPTCTNSSRCAADHQGV
jgi:hypothetical protein